jgi:hypothetical protein
MPDDWRRSGAELNAQSIAGKSNRPRRGLAGTLELPLKQLHLLNPPRKSSSLTPHPTTAPAYRRD